MVEQKQNREEFIEQNLPLVHSICRRFIGRGIEYDDLFGAGCIGLVKATDAFDSNRGFAFSTYAVPVIMGEVRRLFRDGGAVKISRRLKELYLKIGAKQQTLEQKLCRPPTVGELAQELGVGVEEITEALAAGQSTVSLTAWDDDGDSQSDVRVDSQEDEICNRVLLDNAFKCLDECEYRIVKYRYFDALTQSNTAKLMNMSQVQVSRAERKILQKLRKYLA